jgi:hypothetical protein
MLKRRNIGEWLMFIISFSIFLIGFASAEDSVLSDSEHADAEISNPHQFSPDYGPFRDDVIEEVKKSPYFIATRGTLPNITADDEKVEWSNSVFMCSQSLSDPSSSNTGINPYFAELGGPVVLFGYSGEGYIEVGLESESREKVNESVINEIYQVIDEHCEKEGIRDVPVVFMWEHIVEDELLPEDDIPDEDEGMITIMGKDGNYITVDKDDVYIDKDVNFVIKDNETTQKTNETTNQIPGFTSIMLILCLLFLV